MLTVLTMAAMAIDYCGIEHCKWKQTTYSTHFEWRLRCRTKETDPKKTQKKQKHGLDSCKNCFPFKFKCFMSLFCRKRKETVLPSINKRVCNAKCTVYALFLARSARCFFCCVARPTGNCVFGAAESHLPASDGALHKNVLPMLSRCVSFWRP